MPRTPCTHWQPPRHGLAVQPNPWPGCEAFTLSTQAPRPLFPLPFFPCGSRTLAALHVLCFLVGESLDLGLPRGLLCRCYLAEMVARGFKTGSVAVPSSTGMPQLPEECKRNPALVLRGGLSAASLGDPRCSCSHRQNGAGHVSPSKRTCGPRRRDPVLVSGSCLIFHDRGDPNTDILL